MLILPIPGGRIAESQVAVSYCRCCGPHFELANVCVRFWALGGFCEKLVQFVICCRALFQALT